MMQYNGISLLPFAKVMSSNRPTLRVEINVKVRIGLWL